MPPKKEPAFAPLERKKLIRTTYKGHLDKLAAEFEASDKSDAVKLWTTRECIAQKMAEVKKLDNEISELTEDYES